jgi:hypothetical protein
METIRQPKTFQARVIEAFSSQINYNYLYTLLYTNLEKMNYDPINIKYMLKSLFSDIWSFSNSNGYMYSILNSDDIAMRAKLKSGLNIWDEVKRLNIVFYQNRMNNYIYNEYSTNKYFKNKNNNQTPYNRYNGLLNLVPISGSIESNEDYATKMFTADSLQPEGYEYLNDMGPNYEILENQYRWSNKTGTEKYDMGIANNGTMAVGNTNGGREDDERPFDFEFAILETSAIPVTEKNKNKFSNRTHEDAILEFLGENYVSSETIIRQGQTNKNQTNGVGASHLIGSDNGSFMRYKEIPFWQKLSREGIDTDINETLGFGTKETGSHIRGWDMDSLIKGQKSYPRYYGATSTNM